MRPSAAALPAVAVALALAVTSGTALSLGPAVLDSAAAANAQPIDDNHPEHRRQAGPTGHGRHGRGCHAVPSDAPSRAAAAPATSPLAA